MFELKIFFCPILFSQRASFFSSSLYLPIMIIRHLRSTNYLLYFLITYSYSYCVDKNSTCLDLCKGDQPYSGAYTDTYPWDIVCNDWELVGPDSTMLGRKFRSCLSCEKTSSSYDPSTKIGDVWWMLCRPYPSQISGPFSDELLRQPR